jgi:hypothetical protein
VPTGTAAGGVCWPCAEDAIPKVQKSAKTTERIVSSLWLGVTTLTIVLSMKSSIALRGNAKMSSDKGALGNIAIHRYRHVGIVEGK